MSGRPTIDRGKHIAYVRSVRRWCEAAGQMRFGCPCLRRRIPKPHSTLGLDSFDKPANFGEFLVGIVDVEGFKRDLVEKGMRQNGANRCAIIGDAKRP